MRNALRGPKKISARFAGTCSGCPSAFAAGDTIYWTPGSSLCAACGRAHYSRSVGAMQAKNAQHRAEARWEALSPEERAAELAAREAAAAAQWEKDEAERAVLRKSAWEAEKAERAAAVRKNLSAWLADRSSKPEKMHAWLEAQCRMVGLLP